MLQSSVRGSGNHHMHKTGPSRTRITQAEPLEVDCHRDTAESLQRMRDTGFVVFKNLLSPDEAAQLRALMDETGGDDEGHYRRGHYGKDEADPDFRRYDKHIGQPFCTDHRFLKYTCQAPAVDVVEGVHGHGTRLIGGSIWVTGRGRHPMGLHIDYQPFALPEDIASDPRVEVPIMISTLHYYLNDMYMELGPTLVVEGSHKAGRAPDEDTGFNGKEAKAFMCRAGDALLFRSDIWHGALPNTSDERRYMLQVHYGSAYMQRPFETPWQKNGALPDAFAPHCDARLRRLLGERQEGYEVPQGSYVLNQDGEDR